RERIGIEHHRTLALERSENQIPHGLPHTASWSQQHDVAAGGGAGGRGVIPGPPGGRPGPEAFPPPGRPSLPRGGGGVRTPAPARNAPRAASRAAPVEARPPDTTTAWPRAYLCPSIRGNGKLLAQRSGELIETRGLI